MDKSPTSSNPFHNTHSKDAIEKLPSISSLGAFLASLNQTSNNSRLRRFLDETGSLDVNISDTNSCHLSDISSVSNTFYNQKDVDEEEDDNESLGCETNASFDNIIDSASSYRSEDGSIEDFENDDKSDIKESKNDYVDIIDMVNNNYISEKKFNNKRNESEEVNNISTSTEKPRLDDEIKNFMSHNSTPIHQANSIDMTINKKQENNSKAEHKIEIENIQLESFSPPSVIHDAETCSDFKTNEINTEKSLIKIKSQSFNSTDSFKPETKNKNNDDSSYGKTASPQESKKCDVYENKFVTNNLKDLKMSNDILQSSKKQQTKPFIYNSSKASKVTLEFFCSKVGENNGDGGSRIKDTFRLHKLQDENMDNINTISELFKSHTTSEAKLHLVKNNDSPISAQDKPSELTAESHNPPVTTTSPQPVHLTPPLKAAPIASKRTLKTKDQVFPGTAKRVENKPNSQNHVICDKSQIAEHNFKSLKENDAILNEKSNLISKKASEEDRTNKLNKRSKNINENVKSTKTEIFHKNGTNRQNDISEQSGIKKSKTLEFGKEDIEMSLQEIRSLLYGKEIPKGDLEGIGKIEYEEREKSIRDYVNVAKSKSFHTNPFYDLDNEIDNKVSDNNHNEKIKSKKFHSSESKINKSNFKNNEKNEKLEIGADKVSIKENKTSKGNKSKQKKMHDKLKELKNDNLDSKNFKTLKETKKVKKVPGGLKKVVKSKLNQENNEKVFLSEKNNSYKDNNNEIEHIDKEEKSDEYSKSNNINEKNVDKHSNKEQKNKKESNKKINEKQKIYKENGNIKKLSEYETINSKLSSEIDNKETLNTSGSSIIQNHEIIEGVGLVKDVIKKDEKAMKNIKINEHNIVDAKNDVSMIEADENENYKEKLHRMKQNKNNFCNLVYNISNGNKHESGSNESSIETHISKETKTHTKKEIDKDEIKSIDNNKGSPKETNKHKNKQIDTKTDSMSVIDELLEELRKSHIDNNCMDEVYPLDDEANEDKHDMYEISDNVLEEEYLFRNCVQEMYKDKGVINDLTEIYNIKDGDDRIIDYPKELNCIKNYEINDEECHENNYNKEDSSNKNELFNYQINYDIGNRLHNYKNKNENIKVKTKNSKNPFLNSDTENECQDKDVLGNDDLNENNGFDNNIYKENNFLYKSDETFSKNTNNVFNNDFVNEYNHYNNNTDYDEVNYDNDDDYNNNDFHENFKGKKTFTLSPELTECESVTSIISRNNSNDNYTNGDDKDDVRKTDEEEDDEVDEKKDDDDDMSPSYMPHVFDGLSSNDENNDENEEDNDKGRFYDGDQNEKQFDITNKPIKEKLNNIRKLKNNYNDKDDEGYDNKNELTNSLLKNANKENNIQKITENKYNARQVLKHEDKPLPNIAYNKEISRTTHKQKSKMNEHENKHKSSEKYKQKQHENTEEKQKIDAKPIKCNSNERVHNKTDDIFIRKSRHTQKGTSRKGPEKQLKGETCSEGSTELKKECLKISFCSVEEIFFKKTRI